MQQLTAGNIGEETEDYIRKQAHIYGRDPKKELTEYQKRINTAAEQLALNNPILLHTRRALLEAAREMVDESGYVYKKGKSRSKQLNPSAEELIPRPKRQKTTEVLRQDRIAHIEDGMKGLDQTLVWKEKRREVVSDSRNYRECEEITEEMGILKQKRHELRVELQELQKKQRKSDW